MKAADPEFQFLIGNVLAGSIFRKEFFVKNSFNSL